jgi:ankyrin repeat protein
VKAIRTLMRAGASLEDVTPFGSTPLHCAANNGHLEAIRELLWAGATVNAVNNDGGTALHHSAFHGTLAVSQELLRGRPPTLSGDDGASL